jgi:hypothetical protein
MEWTNDAITTLRNVDTIEIGDKAKILERWRGFVGKSQPGADDVADGTSNGLRGTGEGKVIRWRMRSTKEPLKVVL